jgi:AraC-like DNA-binding protein
MGQNPYVGLKSQPPGYSFATDCYDQEQIIYVTSGDLRIAWPAVDGGRNGAGDTGRRGRRRSETFSGMLEHGRAVLLPVGSAFRLSSETGYTGVFSLTRYPDATRVASPTPRAAICAADGPLRQVTAMLVAEMTAPAHDEILTTMGRLFAELTHRCIARGRNSARHVDDAAFWTSRVCQIIDSHLYSGASLHELFAGLGRSYRQLTRDVRAALGISPKTYQIQRRCEEAIRLLHTTRLSVTEIAMELGYPSSQHFSAQFRRTVGCTPTEARNDGYRKRTRGFSTA